MNVTTKVVLGAVSMFLFIIAACLLVATIALAWLYGTQRNPEGFVESQEVSMTTGGYAITSTDLDLGALPEDWIPSDVVGTLQVQAQSEDGSPLFVGVGPSNDVETFLTDVEHTEVTRFGNQERLSYTDHPGSVIPQPPGDLGIWTVSSEGVGRRTLDWEPESGQWTLVVMNSDAASGLDVSASVGVNTPWIPIGMWITGVLTFVVAVGAVVIAVLAAKQPATVEASDTGSHEPASRSS